jgi:hypothetical protein
MEEISRQRLKKGVNNQRKKANGCILAKTKFYIGSRRFAWVLSMSMTEEYCIEI